MKYKYNNPYYPIRTISLKHGVAEWVNQDCPRVLDENGRVVIDFDYGARSIYPLDEQEEALILEFIRKSDIAFCNKYKHLKFTPGNLLNDIKVI